MPESWDWKELASCVDDPRFTGRKPDEETLQELEAICWGCEVRQQCADWASKYPYLDLMAAGEWHECPNEMDAEATTA